MTVPYRLVSSSPSALQVFLGDSAILAVQVHESGYNPSVVRFMRVCINIPSVIWSIDLPLLEHNGSDTLRATLLPVRVQGPTAVLIARVEEGRNNSSLVTLNFDWHGPDEGAHLLCLELRVPRASSTLAAEIRLSPDPLGTVIADPAIVVE